MQPLGVVGVCAGEDLPSDFVAYSRAPSDYTSIIEIHLGSLLSGYLLVSHIFVTPMFFMEL